MYYLCGRFLAIYMKHTVMELKMTAQYDGKPHVFLVNYFQSMHYFIERQNYTQINVYL